MVRSKFKVLCSLLCVFLLTGCVKVEENIVIHKDKSMDVSIVGAVNSAMLGQSGFDESELEKAKNNGFKVEKYSDNDKVGYKITKSISNIENASNKDISVQEVGKEKPLFTVEKGLFKNKYIFNLSSSDNVTFTPGEGVTAQDDNSDEGATLANDEGSLDSSDSASLADDNVLDTDDSSDSSEEETSDMDLSSLSSMMGSMEMNYTVDLPYKALSNNATSVNNDGKKLTWDLTKMQNGIEFEFELYNMNNIYIAGGVALLVVIIIVLIIVSKIKKGKKGNPVLVEEPDVNLDNTSMATPTPAVSLNYNEGVVTSKILQPIEPVVEPAPVAETVVPVESVQVAEPVVSEETEPTQELTASGNDQEVNASSMSSFDPFNATVVNSQEKADEIFADNKNLN